MSQFFSQITFSKDFRSKSVVVFLHILLWGEAQLDVMKKLLWITIFWSCHRFSVGLSFQPFWYIKIFYLNNHIVTLENQGPAFYWIAFYSAASIFLLTLSSFSALAEERHFPHMGLLSSCYTVSMLYLGWCKVFIFHHYALCV